VAEPIVCPFCGMTTWVDGHCALPGCEGHDVEESTVLYVIGEETVIRDIENDLRRGEREKHLPEGR
jgi:hypothetical protein